MRGLLITFEGVEGSGKSTQAELLVNDLRQQGYKVLFSREPGGTEIGERVRRILLDPDCRRMDGLTELFLYLASRNQHVRERVMPAIQAGQLVVLDRFADSSVAYQGCGRQLGAKLVQRLNKLATAGLRPDLTILVDLPVAVGQMRKRDGELDRMEREEIQFHERVRQGYLELARRAPGRIKVVDGQLPAGELSQAIRKFAIAMLQRKGWWEQ